MADSSDTRKLYRCSFCGKNQDQVQRLIAGPGGIYICDECIELCQEIIEEEQVNLDASAPSVVRTLQQREIYGALARKDWHDVIQKVNDLSDEARTSEIYCVKGQAFLAIGDKEGASNALTLALTAARTQQLKLLAEHTTILIGLDRWREVLDYTEEALILVPNDTKWLALQERSIAQLELAKKETIDINTQ
jgi:hypothetical protein